MGSLFPNFYRNKSNFKSWYHYKVWSFFGKIPIKNIFNKNYAKLRSIVCANILLILQIYLIHCPSIWNHTIVYERSPLKVEKLSWPNAWPSTFMGLKSYHSIYNRSLESRGRRAGQGMSGLWSNMKVSKINCE